MIILKLGEFGKDEEAGLFSGSCSIPAPLYHIEHTLFFTRDRLI